MDYNTINQIRDAIEEYELYEGVYPRLLVTVDLFDKMLIALNSSEYRAILDMQRVLFGASVRIRPDDHLREEGWELK